MKSVHPLLQKISSPFSRDIALIALVTIIAGTFWSVSFLADTSPGFDPVELARKGFASNLDFWKSEIERQGPLRAYEEFKSGNENVPPGPRHLFAHIFGTALYEVEGVSGIAVCDPTYGFGCFHGFFIAAIQDGGPTTLKSLDEACVKSFGPLGTGCQHGIGHGIVEYMGHDKLEESLALCGETTEAAPLIGCSSGVYMEYFLQTGLLGTATSSEPKRFDATAPYGPCPSVSEDYRAACFWALPNWWIGGAMEEVSFEEVARLCSGIADSSGRNACMLGVGALVSSHNKFSPTRSAKICDEITSGQGRVYCRAGVAWNIFSVVHPIDSGRSACHGLPAEDRATCLRAADYTEGLDPAAP